MSTGISAGVAISERCLSSDKSSDNQVHTEAGFDDMTETNGLSATSHMLGPCFSDGLQVAQGDHHVMPSANQNFKLVDGKALAGVYQTPCSIE